MIIQCRCKAGEPAKKLFLQKLQDATTLLSVSQSVHLTYMIKEEEVEVAWRRSFWQLRKCPTVHSWHDRGNHQR